MRSDSHGRDSSLSSETPPDSASAARLRHRFGRIAPRLAIVLCVASALALVVPSFALTTDDTLSRTRSDRSSFRFRPAAPAADPPARDTSTHDATWMAVTSLAVVAVLLAVAVGVTVSRLRRRVDELETALADEDARLAQLRQSETQYRTLFEATSDAVMLLDKRGFLECNEATLRVFGFKTKEQFVACHPAELSPLVQFNGRDSRSAADEQIDEAFRTGSSHFHWTHRRHGGETFMADVLLTRIDLPNRSVLLALVRDITDRIRTENELRESVRQSRRANAVKTMFLANISHELRTPLHAILSFASLAGRRIDRISSRDMLDFLRLIDENGQQLLSLIDDLLDLSTLEAGLAEMVFREVELKTLLLNVIDECHALAASRSVSVSLADDETKTMLACDQARVKQVVRNLLRNAVQFSHFGGVVQVVVSEEKDSIVVSVADHGIGIPEEELETVFDKFVQSGKARAGSGRTGLGLAICREIVLGHGGEIWAQNRPQGGTIIYFRLPRRPCPRRFPQHETTVPAATTDAETTTSPNHDGFVSVLDANAVDLPASPAEVTAAAGWPTE